MTCWETATRPSQRAERGSCWWRSGSRISTSVSLRAWVYSSPVAGSTSAAPASRSSSTTRYEHVGVARVDQRGLVRPAEQVGGMVQVVGVERVVEADQHGERGAALPAGAPRLLPEGGDRAGEAVEHDRVQPTDVHAQLERVGGRHAQELAG